MSPPHPLPLTSTEILPDPLCQLVELATRAARNTRHRWEGRLASLVGGEPDERGEPDPSIDRSGVSAPARRGGDGAAVRRRRVLPGGRQGAGQVRDAARAPGGRD